MVVVVVVVVVSIVLIILVGPSYNVRLVLMTTLPTAIDDLVDRIEGQRGVCQCQRTERRIDQMSWIMDEMPRLHLA